MTCAKANYEYYSLTLIKDRRTLTVSGETVCSTEALTDGIAVLAYSTVQRYRQKDLDPLAVGQNLLVRAVAAGEMIRHNDEVLLHVELIDVGCGAQLLGCAVQRNLFRCRRASRETC